jgi:hypothetical protein
MLPLTTNPGSAPVDAYIKGTGYDYPDLPGLGNNNEKLGLPERLSTGIQFRFRNLFHLPHSRPF